jgi:pilus assembly protein CpaC
LVLYGQVEPQADSSVQVSTSLSVDVGKSLLIQSPVPIERVAVGYGDFAEARAVTPQEILLNGRNPGVTSLIVWQRDRGKLFYDITVRSVDYRTNGRVEAMNRELKRELPGQEIETSFENDTVFLRGHVKDMVSADRAVAIAATVGNTVNLLYVDVPPVEEQILLKVRFATVDRNASVDLGMNLASTGATNTIGRVSTQQFSAPAVTPGPAGTAPTLSDALNIFLFRPDLNLLATIKALQRKSLLEILAEPNVLAMNGKPASFLAGGEFPYPIFQAGNGGSGSVTIQFREFGVRLNFTPIVTPRGTIRLQVAPEVSALDFTGGLVVQGFNIPALTVRKVNTEIELASGQSFAIGGLIDNRLTETISKLPVLGDLPVLGKLFESKSRLKENTELLVIVTPERVAPSTQAQPGPDIKFPQPLMWPGATTGEPNAAGTERAPVQTVPIETLIRSVRQTQPTEPPAPLPPPASNSAPPAANSSARGTGSPK